MDPVIKAKWLEALRSKKYKQGAGCLRSADTEGNDVFCCLGVLCDIVAPDRWNTDTLMNTHQGVSLTPNLFLLCEIKLLETQAEKLANMNDNGASFSDIADYIEEYI